ncbi:hypothetical protein [Paracoccus sp. pheM1]|uniref:hypothetical protein n=1 Tax=Paracoccus sp. pheM1 TaxID=2831675 RepID=UPI001BDB81FC|nr:hypothetical protein [Paracoccus sp. pheM1]MBT0780563.1 hypothetical protein [Paracoccus sp. pheM1]
MASATKRIILSSGWVKIAEAKGREAMAMIDAYGAVQLAVADGEPPRGDVASGHSLNGSMMWPVKGAEIIWARGAGVAVSVTLLKVVPEFATLDSAALKVATASAQAVATAAAGAAATADAKATSADAKATEAQQVQARRDFATWRLADFIDQEHLDLIRDGNWQGQDEVYVTSCIRAFNTDWMTWWAGGNNRMVRVEWVPGVLAMNAPVYGEDHAQILWDMNGAAHGENRVYFSFPSTRIRVKNWLTIASERSTGYYAANAISGPVPQFVWEWEQSGGNAFIGAMEGDLTIQGFGVPGLDPGGYRFFNCAKFKIGTLRARGLRNEGLFIENCVNGDFDNVDLFNCGYQPTEYGGDRGHLPFGVTFSNVGAVVNASVATFNSSHVGKWFGLNRAGPVDQGIRLNFWSTIASVDSPTQITLAAAPAVNRTGATGSFEAMRVTTAGTTWTMAAAVSTNLAGRYVTLVCAMSSQPGALARTHKVRVLAHSGDVLTVDYAPAEDVTDALLVFSPQLSVDRLSYTALQNRSDNIGFLNLRCEATGFPGVGCVQAVLGVCSGVSINNAKLHGLADDSNNFGGAASALVLGHANGVLFDGWIEQSSHSPRWGTVMVTSDRTVVDLYGKITEYAGDNRSALVYLDPPASATRVQVGFGMIHPSELFPQASQEVVRMGPHATANMVTGGNSSRRSATNAKFLFTERFGAISFNSATGSGVTTGQSGFTGTGQLMAVGFGGDSGGVEPNLPPSNDLDLATAQHGSVRCNSSTLNAPDAVGGWVVDVRKSTTTIVVQRAYRVQFGVAPIMVLRHNNMGGGAWSAWCYPDGTPFTP